jgi:hypothetical protein
MSTLTGRTSATLSRPATDGRVHIGDDDMARADMAGDGGRHDADGARAGDEHVLADQIEGESAV